MKNSNFKLPNIIGFLLMALVVFVVLDWPYFHKTLFSGKTYIYYFSKESEKKTGSVLLPNYLSIPNLKIKVPIVYPVSKSENTFSKVLEQGVVHFPQTALPGELGNCYIFGHSSDMIWKRHPYKNTFALLPSLSIGDKVIISNAAGKSFVYEIFASRQVAGNNVSVLDQQGYKKYLLTIQTSYPVGTALSRWVVQAELKQ